VAVCGTAPSGIAGKVSPTSVTAGCPAPHGAVLVVLVVILVVLV
jgi:hypothetical protein